MLCNYLALKIFISSQRHLSTLAHSKNMNPSTHTHPHSLGLTTRLLIDSPTECTYRICPDTIHAQHTHIHINELNFLLMLHNLQVHQWELQVHLMFPQKLHALCNVLNRVVENEFGDQSECHVVLEFDWDAKGNYPFNLKAKQCPVFFYLWNI